MRSDILILTNSIGGLYSFRKEVVKAIIDAGLEVHISVPDTDSEKADYFRKIGCHFLLTKFNRRGTSPIADLKLFITYRRLMKSLKPMAVLTYTIKPNIYGGMAARISRVPQLSNITGLGDAMENGGWMKWLTVMLYRIGLKKAWRVFFQNESNRVFCIRKGIARKDSILLPGSGVNLEFHSLQEYPKNEGRVRFLFIGRLLKDKGIDEFFEAAEHIFYRYPKTEFQVLGRIEGPYRGLIDRLESCGVIKYLGVTTDVRPFIGAVECTVMPSYHEGMSNVNLESAANGRPVITTNVPGCRETVDNGVTGFLVEAKNTRSLEEAIEHFIQLPYNKKVLMGVEARNKVEREFDRGIVVTAYLKELDQIKRGSFGGASGGPTTGATV